MKKKGKPYVLVSALIVCFGVVFAMNYRPIQNNNPAQPPAPEQVTGEKRETKTTAQDLATVAAKKAPPQAKMSRMMTPDGEEKIPPSIQRPKDVIHRPTPNDSTIAGQWYQEEANTRFGRN